MKIYNSLSKEKESFTALTPGKVSMYHCGPTVYDYVHIGNLRSFILGDFTRRSFEFLGYDVTQVMNITDVGHLVSDGDEGDDKMTKALKREGKEITVENMLNAATKYAEAFKEDIATLNMLKPHHIPRASEHIDGNIEIIQMLEKKGYSYLTSDGVYFDTSKMPTYGALGGIDIEDESTGRTSNKEKRQQADFALWKLDENQGWDSPWGQGFPGWHIECSSMSRAFLGDHFDIHTGGLDNLPIHHNNEIAQSTCALDTKFVNYWMHGGILNLGGAKLSKSTGGNITLRTLTERGIDPLAYRYLTLQTHYHSPMNFTWEILQAAQNGLHKVRNRIAELQNSNKAGSIDSGFLMRFQEKIEDDINLPQALAIFHELLKSDLTEEDILATAYRFDTVLGLDLENWKEEEINTPQEVQELLKEREQARQEKNWEQSDILRDQISELGFIVSDVKGEQKISKK